MTLELHVSKRDTATDAKTVRDQGMVPGIVYGPKQEPTPVSIEKVAFEKTLATGGESTIISLQGLSEEVDVLIHDVAFNPGRGGVMHVDFYAIEKGKELTTNIPLEFIGTAPAEKFDGVLTKVLHEVEVTCKPKDLPSHIDVDVSTLATFDDQIKVSDLVIPAGVTITQAADEMVAVVVPVAEEIEDAGEVDMSAVEVEQKGKQEEESESA